MFLYIYITFSVSHKFWYRFNPEHTFSSEMPEVLGISDEILVMHEGRIKGTLTREEATQEKIMQLAVKV